MRKQTAFLTGMVFFGLTGGALSYDAPPAEPGFELLFDGKDITRHFVNKGNPASWKVVDGVIVARSGGDRIMSKQKYRDFVLRLDWITFVAGRPRQSHLYPLR